MSSSHLWLRPRRLALLMAAVFTLTSGGAASAAVSPWGIFVVGRQSDAERLSAVDLQRYLAQVTGVVPAILNVEDWRAKPRPAVVLGTPEGNPLLRELDIDTKDLGDQGYYVAQQPVGGASVVIAAGTTPAGATNAVYGLLRELGYGFYLGSEAIPESIPDALKDTPVVRKPVFAVRGVLPWYNFFDSPTAWDPIDHRTFADQLIRSGANFVGFHTYDTEPFAAYDDGGKMKWGQRLLNTKTPTWGTASLPTSGFGFDTGKLFDGEFFGAASTLDIVDADKAVRAEQDIMRDALDYAHKRGLYTCLGFEVQGDPLKPAVRDIFLKRINRVLDQYPALDFIWLWQPEAQGALGFREGGEPPIPGAKFEAGSLLPAYGLARRETFHRIVERRTGEGPFFQDTEAGKTARTNEAARLELYAQLAYHALAHREHPPKLVISGWGGDERILSAEYYDGLDKLLPADVVFSSLDHIVPRPRVDAIYNELPPGRQRWPIPWLEYDGDQWHPQPWVHVYEGLVRDAHKGGSQGILGIHWRTREVEENLAYLIQYAWNPGLTAEQFFADYARRCYGPQIAEEMAAIHSALDKLGYRWVGGGGQGECGGFTWGPGEEGKVKALTQLREEVATLLPNANRVAHRLSGGEHEPTHEEPFAPPPLKRWATRLEWLINEMDWVLQYREAELAAVKARGLVARAGGAESESAKQQAQQALDALENGNLGRAMHTFAQRISTRGEYGVLATINTKAYAAWRDLRKECLRLGATPSAAEADQQWKPDPQIVLPRLVGSVEAGRELDLSVLVLGGGKAWAHLRPLGEKAWQTRPLKPVGSAMRTESGAASSSPAPRPHSGPYGYDWVQHVVVPPAVVASPGFEIGFSFSEDPTQPLSLGPIAITAMPPTPADTPARRVRPADETAELVCAVKAGGVMPIELTWNPVPAADCYRVYRDGAPVVETAVAMFPDYPTQPKGTYVIEALRDGEVIAKSKPVEYAAPQRPTAEAFDLTLRSNGAFVLLRWPPSKSPLVTAYRVTRAHDPSDGREPEVIARVAASHTDGHVHRDAPPPGRWTYSVTPIDVFRHEDPAVTASIEFQPAGSTAAPRLDIPLTAQPRDGRLVGNVAFGEGGATFKGGYLVFPDNDGMKLDRATTVAFEFKADSVDGMPVLLCHGSWQVDGWFAQILGGQLIVRTTAGDAQGPPIEPGKWYSVRFIFDGEALYMGVNGNWGEVTPVRKPPVPAKRGLVIAQYEHQEPQYAFKGILRNVRIYDGVVVGPR